MSVYSLTYNEAWALATMLHLPVQPGSVLANWLNTGEEPSAGSMNGKSLDSLAAKGYYSASKSAQPIVTGLINSLALVSVNAAELTAVIRTGEKASIVRFAQVGKGIVQYGADENKFSFHDVAQMRNVSQTLLPAWFKTSINENLFAEFPIGAFLLFKHACAMADWAAGRSGLETETFSQAELFEMFKRSAAWMDVYNAASVKGAPAIDKMPLESFLDLLITRGYLNKTDNELLEIGTAGKPLASAFSDPGMCTLSLTMQTWEDAEVPTGVFLHGGNRLFLLEFISGQMAIRQLASVESGRFWIENLLDKGSNARYAKYDVQSVPPAPAKKPAKSAPIEAAVPSKAAPAISGASSGGKFCGKCGTAVQQDMKFCSSCGASIQSSQPKTSTCPGCGKPVKADISFCGSCGYKLK